MTYCKYLSPIDNIEFHIKVSQRAEGGGCGQDKR